MQRRQNTQRPTPIPVTCSFTVRRSDELLSFLLSRFEGKLSRNSVKKLLSDRKVLVNGSLTTQYNFPLAKDDEVKIAKNPIRTQPVRKAPSEREVSSIQPYILYEDEYFLALNKPAGLLSVESDKEQRSAYSLAADYLRKKEKNCRPYVLHRIDKETSGVLVFAKDIRVHSMLKMHWNEDVTLREYIAAVDGVMEEKQGTLISYLKENQNHQVYVTQDPHGKKAITHYEVLKENPPYSLLRVTIDTGRKNQIRAQMDSIGHPVIGDEKYRNIPSPIHRLCLHASILEFIHPLTEKPMRFSAPVPSEFNRLFR